CQSPYHVMVIAPEHGDDDEADAKRQQFAAVIADERIRAFPRGGAGHVDRGDQKSEGEPIDGVEKHQGAVVAGRIACVTVGHILVDHSYTYSRIVSSIRRRFVSRCAVRSGSSGRSLSTRLTTLAVAGS